MKCSQCGHQQAEGAFCGQCGGELVALSKESTSNDSEEKTGLTEETAATEEMGAQGEEVSAATTKQSSSQQGQTSQQETGNSTEAMDRVVETSKEFGSFFQRFIKNPSIAFTEGAHQLTNGLITLAIVAILFSLAFYNFINVDIGFGGYDMGPSFLSTAGNAIVFIGISMAIVIAIIFIINKLFGNDELSFMEITSIYGVLMTPTVIVAALALLLILIKSYVFGSLILILTIGFSTTFIPVYIVNHLAITYRKNLDPLYVYLIYIFVSSIALILIYGMMADSMVGGFMNDLLDFDPYGF